MKTTTLKRLSAFFATAVMAVTCNPMNLSAEAGAATLTLTDTSAVAGKYVTVDLTMNTGNQCAGYNIDVEFDNALTLVNVEGVASTCTIDNVVTLINFTGTNFADGKVLSTLTFEVPANAEEGAIYNVGVQTITNFCTAREEFTDVIVDNSKITVIESAKKVTRHIVYMAEDGSGSAEVALRGDINNDGKVDLYDVILVTKKMMKKQSLNDKQTFFADVNEDSSVDLYDAIGICRFGMAKDKDNAWENIIK